MSDDVSDFRKLVMECRELLWLVGYNDMNDPDQPFVPFEGPKQWQDQVDHLWNVWRATFPDRGPPPRPRQVRTRDDIQDALDSLLRELKPNEPPVDQFLKFSGKQRLLLSSIDGKGAVPIDAVLTAVYGTASKDNLDALMKLKDRTNRSLAMKQHSQEIKKKGETLSLGSI